MQLVRSLPNWIIRKTNAPINTQSQTCPYSHKVSQDKIQKSLYISRGNRLEIHINKHRIRREASSVSYRSTALHVADKVGHCQYRRRHVVGLLYISLYGIRPSAMPWTNVSIGRRQSLSPRTRLVFACDSRTSISCLLYYYIVHSFHSSL